MFIDIFPLDGVPDNYFLRSIKNFECFCIRKILWSRVGMIAEKNRGKRQVYKVLGLIPEKYVFRYYHRMIHRANLKGKYFRELKIMTAI